MDRETVQLNVRISKEVDEVMRELLPARRGELRRFIEEAILEKLERDYGLRR